jgi:hypothetical protein
VNESGIRGLPAAGGNKALLGGMQADDTCGEDLTKGGSVSEGRKPDWREKLPPRFHFLNGFYAETMEPAPKESVRIRL